MTKTVLLFLAIVLTSIGALAQNDQFTGQAIQIGPFGEPILVIDQFGNFTIPIKIYSDPEIDTFIPDVTSAGWIAWNGKLFREKGIYEVCVYRHFKKPSFCLRELIQPDKKNDPALIEGCSKLYYQQRVIHVDTRQKTVTISANILFDNTAMYARSTGLNAMKPKTFPLRTPGIGPQFAKEISRITAIITEAVEKDTQGRSY